MEAISSPHDRLFKAALGDIRVAREFFTRHLPDAIRESLDCDSLQFCNTTYIDNELKLSQSDVLYKATIADEAAYLYLLLEQQTNADPLMPFRLLKYTIGIWDDHLKQTGIRKLPLIVSMVFYNGQEPYIYSTDLRDLIDAPKKLIDEVWLKPFTLISAQGITDEVAFHYPWSGMMEFFMKHVKARDFLHFLKQSIEVLRLLEMKDGADYVIALLNYIMQVAEIHDFEHFVETVKTGLSSLVGDKIMTIEEMLIQRGLQRGVQQGIEQGIEQGVLLGEHTVLVNMLKHKFAAISTEYIKRIKSADEETILNWSKRLLEAKNIEEVFEG